ncbi:hypothetical protein KY343_00180 [Candidatus Woesearchaeota archaeon]|nr:hypothetical protein [Candidatus Woesearchaeota archaeon]
MRAIKKIIALATGATMLGATIMGAMAANLADFPSPLLIKDTTFDADIVYGVNADPSDIMGLVDAVAAISVVETGVTVEGGDEVAIEGDSWKAETSSKLLELGESLSSIQSTITEDELNALADGTFTAKNDADYEQEMRFSGNVVLSYEEDTDEDVVSTFLTLDDDMEILNYTLTFTTSAESDVDDGELEDFEDQTIKILGIDYTMTKTELSTDNYALELTMMGGALLDTMEQGQVKTYTLDGKDYEVEVTYIGGLTESTCKFKINGETTDSMVEGDTYTLADDTDIGVREILEEEAGEVTADMIEFYLGADKIVLQDPNISDRADFGDMEVGDETMDEVEVDLAASVDASGEFLFESIKLIYTADDDYWFGPGQKLSEKVDEPEAMINWDIAYEGMTSASMESIELIPAGDEQAELNIEVADGDVSIPVAYADDNTIWLGEETDRLVLTRGTLVEKDQFFFLSTGTGVPDEGEKSYVLQYKGADNSGSSATATLNFDNLAGDSDPIERSFNKATGQATLTLGGQEFTIVNKSDATEDDDFNISISGGATEGYLVTDGDALILIAQPGGDNSTVQVRITEADPSGMVESDVQSWINLTLNENEDEIAIDVDTITTGSLITDPDDNDVSTQMTVYGAKVTVTDESSGPDKVEIDWPSEQLVGQAFVTSGEVRATIVGSVGGAVLQKVTIPLAKSDDDVLTVDPAMNRNNYLLVGGPCANRATAKVLGSGTSWPGCADGFEEGVGRILVKEMNGNVAMVVAGMTALDTTRATRVLKDYQSYDLSGDEVEVLGTTATPQTVRAVSS